eukprot:Nitzschia sp. Nitz4//scaffold247_size31676//9063//10613//NITZ4_007927-RA/size31676-processed-gene-0.37-mRNA-1//-1//CDS//3329543946//6129//frame0
MGKKSKRVRNNKEGGDAEDDTKQARHQQGAASNKNSDEVETADNLRFEDPFVDEYIVEDEEAEDGMEEDMDGEGHPQGNNGDAAGMEVIQSWHPLMGGEPPEDLEMDPSAYKMHHTLAGEWPSLSFDFLRDTLGDARQRFPHSLQAAIGTQAPSPDDNHLTILQLSDLCKIPNNNEEDDILGEEYDKQDDNDDDSDDEEDEDLDPVMEHFNLPHRGGVNRIRAMPQNSDIIATWSDFGIVNIYNVRHVRSRFHGHNSATDMSSSMQPKDEPYYVHSGHGTEGFALDWSKANQGHLASGDCQGAVHLWKPRDNGTSFEVNSTYETVGGHSVEDLQWSPSEKTVICAAEAGGFMSIYDTRAPNRAMLRPLIAENGIDVNVCSWNHLVSNLLATGSDDGTLSVWDLRTFGKGSNKADPLAQFTCHKTPITSVEWHPTDESMLSVSDTVGAYVYDLSVEEDAPQQQSDETKMLVADIPPQLLFCHSGSTDFKELHWHPQISSCIMTTAYSGFSVFIPSNL